MIKKSLYLWIVCLCLLFLGGCNRVVSSPNESSGTFTEGIEDITDEQKSDSHWTIYYKQQGKLTDESTSDTVFVHTCEGGKNLLAELYLSVQINDRVLTCDLGNWEQMVFKNGTLRLFDLDNDGTDEIILFMEITGNGGSLARVYAVQDNQIVLLCDFDAFDIDFDTVFLDDFIMLLETKKVGFSQAYNISKEYGAEQFDKNGRLMFESDIYLWPIDTNSVIFELIDEQLTIRYNRPFKLTNRLGELQMSFQYDVEQKAFQCVEIREIKA